MKYYDYWKKSQMTDISMFSYGLHQNWHLCKWNTVNICNVSSSLTLGIQRTSYLRLHMYLTKMKDVRPTRDSSLWKSLPILELFLAPCLQRLLVEPNVTHGYRYNIYLKWLWKMILNTLIRWHKYQSSR